MKGELLEYNDGGNILKKEIIECRITWGDKNPLIEISLSDRTKTIHRSIHVPLQKFINVYNKQVNSKRVSNIRECYNG